MNGKNTRNGWKTKKMAAMSLFLLVALATFGSTFSAISLDAETLADSGNLITPDLAVEKQMIFMLHYVNATETSKTLPDGSSTWTYFDTTLEWNDENVTIVASGTNQLYEWYLWPSLAGDFTTDSFTFRIWGNATGGASVSAQTTVRILRVNSTGEYLIHEENFGNVPYPISPTLKNFTANFTATTFYAGDSIKMEFEVTPGVSNTIMFYYDTARANSRVEFRSADSFRIENIRTLDYQGVLRTNFDPAAPNTTIKIRVNLTDPFGAYDIKWVNLTLYDPNNTIILNNVTMWKVAGTPVDYRAEYNYTWNYSAYASFRGRYNMTIWAVDNNGYNWYYHFEQYNFGSYYDMADGYFYIGKMPNYAWFKVYDNNSSPLKGAIVQAVLSNSVVSWNYTNQTGMTNITISPGTYDFRVVWQDVYVGNVTANVSANITEDNPIIINCSVYNPILRAVDSWGLPLDGSVFYITHPNGTKMDPITANSWGNVSLISTPIGEYSVIVRWRGIVVYNGNLMINSSAVYILNCEVYHVTFHAVDAQGNPLSDIGIAVFDNLTGLILDFRQTDFEGNATMRIPAVTIRVEAYWQNLLVNETSGLVITGDDYIVLECQIYSVIFHAFDSHTLPVQNAQIFIKTDINGDVIDSIVTDSQGNATSVLPAGTYYMEVIWNTVVVNAGYITINDTTEVIPVECSIYYVTFHTVDSQGVDISNAQITIKTSDTGTSLGSAFTDERGNATLRLPKTDTDIQVYWHETVVYSGTYLVAGDDYQEIDCWVYYVTFHTVDSQGVDISNAQITIKTSDTGTSLSSGSTDLQGEIIFRLPMTEIYLEVYWSSILVNSSSYSVIDDRYVEVQCSIYYVTFHVVDSRNISVESSSIIVIDDKNNIRETATTNSDGMATLRLPSANYQIEVYWMEALINVTGYTIYSDEVVVVNGWIYYITFEAVDSRDTPVKDATLNIRSENSRLLASLHTDNEGNALARLPQGQYEVAFYWHDVLVNTSKILVSEDAIVEVRCRIYYLGIRALDSQGVSLADAQVVLSRNGVVEDAAKTDLDGRSEYRLPVGNYSMRIYWRDTLVYESNIEITEDTERDIGCWVYYLKISVKDAGESAVANAFVFVHSDDGRNFAKYTEGNGTVSFRLAKGSYTVGARYRGEHFLTNVDVSTSDTVNLDSDKSISLGFQEYPPAIYSTNLFYLLSILILMTALFGYLMMKKKKDEAHTRGNSDNVDGTEENAEESHTYQEETEEKSFEEIP